MIRHFTLVLTAVLMTAMGAQADTLSFCFNDSSAQLRYSYLLHEDYDGISKLQFRGLYNDDNDTALSSAGFEFSGKPGGFQDITLGIGAHLYLGQTDPDETLGALGVAGSLAVNPPSWLGIGLDARLAYAPNILSISDLDRLLEASVGVNYTLTPRVKLFVEYQWLRADLKDQGNTSIDKDFRIGFTGSF